MAVDMDMERQIHAGRELAAEGSLFDSFADQAMRRVEEVIAGRNCPWPPSGVMRQFLTLLRNHQGQKRSVALGAIAERLHMSPRDVKGLVRDLRVSFGVQIGSARGDDSGYYVIESGEECFTATNAIYNQAISELRMVAIMRKGAQTMDQLRQQIALDLTKPEAVR